MNEVKVRVENRSAMRFSVSPAHLEKVVAACGIRDALEDVHVLATFHDYDDTRAHPRAGSAALQANFGGAARIRVKVFVRDNDLASANETFAHEMRHAAQYALYGVWAAVMDAEELEREAYEFADSLADAQVIA